MSFSHFRSLLMRALQLEEQIQREQRLPRADWMRLLKLKKLRLRIKDRLHRLALEKQYGGADSRQLIPVRAQYRRI